MTSRQAARPLLKRVMAFRTSATDGRSVQTSGVACDATATHKLWTHGRWKIQDGLEVFLPSLENHWFS